MAQMAGFYRDEKLGEGKPMSWRSLGCVGEGSREHLRKITGTE